MEERFVIKEYAELHSCVNGTTWQQHKYNTKNYFQNATPEKNKIKSIPNNCKKHLTKSSCKLPSRISGESSSKYNWIHLEDFRRSSSSANRCVVCVFFFFLLPYLFKEHDAAQLKFQATYQHLAVAQLAFKSFVVMF